MCGIAGLICATGKAPNLDIQPCLQAMADRLEHRGPDAEGFWVDDTLGVGLAHRRLSILDLSQAGAQPMHSDDGQYVIIFNGEIYNHTALRKTLASELGQIAWRGHSDTETLLAAITHWGLEEALRRAYGMFALALWDNKAQTLSLARDRMGEKPLYLAQIEDSWFFASELSALKALGDIFPKISLNQSAISSQLSTGVIPDNSCVLNDFRKISPGTILELSAHLDEPREKGFEGFNTLMERGRSQANSHHGENAKQAADRIEQVLGDVITSQMVSDVPLGSFLSGGVDSSLVTSLMQDVSERAIKTFSIGFSDLGYDESQHAESVAEHLGTDHKTFLLHEDDALNLVPQLAMVYDEPFADSSQIPTLLLCREARKHVTVALTGDGGDEIFGGYNRHILAPRLWQKISKLPVGLRRVAPFLGQQFQSLRNKNNLLQDLTNKIGLSASVLNKTARFGEIVGNSTSLEDVYRGLTRQCDDSGRFLNSQAAPELQEDWSELEGLDGAEVMMALDSTGYLPSDILVKVDRASMNASLETRAPFLDARTVEAAWSLNLSQRIYMGVGKAVLRNILERHVPKVLIERPKQGFSVPIDAWLLGPLRSWADALLAKDRLAAGGVLNPDAVRQLWTDHITQRSKHGQLLWSILMLQQWLEAWGFNGFDDASTTHNAGKDKSSQISDPNQAHA